MFKLSKKVIAIALSIISLMLLCSCGFAKEELAIDNHTWKFKYAQNGDGEIVYCNSDNKELYENAEVLDLWNSAKGGVFMISDNETQDTFAFSYNENNKNVESINYNLAYNEQDGASFGTAVVSKTVNENGNDEYTLIISIADYAICFYESIE